MKTVEVAAIEAAKISVNKLFDKNGLFSSAYTRGFLDGIEFAQRWIPVKEELPPESGWDNAPYIVKTKHEKRVVGYTCGRFHLQGGLCLKELAVTHWRPLERL